MGRHLILSVAVLLIVVLTATPALAQPVFQIVLPGPGMPSFRFYFMYPSSVNPGTRFDLTANAQHISGSGSATPVLRVVVEPSNIVFPLTPTLPEMPQYCDPASCSFGFMSGVDVITRITRFQVDANARNGQSLLLKVDASNGGVGPWVYVTDISMTVGPVVKPQLNVVVSPQTLEANKPGTVTITVSGLPSQDTATLTLSGAGVSQTLATTGTIQAQITPTTSGTITITANAPNNTPGTAYIAVTIQVTPLTVAVSPQTIETNKLSTITITVGGLLPGETATLTLSGAGMSQTVTTTGTTQIQISPAEEGTITVTADAPPNHQRGTATITVRVDWIFWIAIVLIVALIAIGVVAVFLLTRRKPSPAAPAYKPFYPPAPPAGLKPAAPPAAAVKPGVHVPRVVARREEEKK